MSATEQDREKARKAIGCDCAVRAADDASPNAGVEWHFAWCAGYYCDPDAIAAALAEERERARALFLALLEVSPQLTNEDGTLRGYLVSLPLLSTIGLETE